MLLNNTLKHCFRDHYTLEKGYLNTLMLKDYTVVCVKKDCLSHEKDDENRNAKYFLRIKFKKTDALAHPLLKTCGSMTKADSMKCVILVTYQSPRWHWEARRCCVTGLTNSICQMLSDSWSSRDNVIKSAGFGMWVNKRSYDTISWFFPFLSFL